MSLASRLPGPVVSGLQRLARDNSRTSRALKRLSGRLITGPQRIVAGPAKGLMIDVAGSRPSYVFGTAEPEVQAFLAQHLRSGDVFYDLGANVGYLTLVGAALVGPLGKVRAYEPLPANVAVLERNVDMNELRHVTVIGAAVSDQTGTDAFAAGATDQDGMLGDGPLQVRTVRLDEEQAPPPNLVKIDVEGAEAKAVEGMRRLLSEHHPVVLCEIHEDPLTLEHPVAIALGGLGYQLSWLEGDAVSWAPHLVAV